MLMAAACGGEIGTYCGKCRMVLDHRIVAVVDHVPVKVICLTCHSGHRYRAPKSKFRRNVK